MLDHRCGKYLTTLPSGLMEIFHEVQEEDEDKANALKTFVDWLERNVDEMIEINNTEDYENILY